MQKKIKLLYVYEERIPLPLKSLVENQIKKGNFLYKKMTYKLSKLKQEKLFEWADAVFFAPGRFIEDDVLKKAQNNVKIFQLWSSGFEKFNIKTTKKLKIPLANNGSQNSTAVSEMAVLLMMAVNRKLPHFHERTITGNWKNNSHGFDLYEMHGKILGIIGFGNIGKKVAKICNSFGMKILYFDKIRAPRKLEKELNVQFVTKDTIIKKSDILSIHLHLNSETKKIIDKKSIQNMKRNSILINVSRSQLVDNKALLQALKNNKIRGAGLDVHDKEPTLKNDELNNHPGVVVTPHISGSTYDTYLRVIKSCLDNIKNTIKNKKNMKWEV
jgi:lactate dehydrogenase-like 2-hydroxyacid dehydrogenase